MVFPIKEPEGGGVDSNTTVVKFLKLRFSIQPIFSTHRRSYTAIFFLPLERRREITRRPPFDFIRSKKPWVLFFLLLLGCR
jgi:hypothetical protein